MAKKIKTGIILFVGGDSTYTRWAENMITSLRYFSPKLPIKVILAGGKRNWMPGFPIDFEQAQMKPKHYTDEQGNFAPGKAKLHLDLYTNFDRTIYADIDGVACTDLAKFLDKIGDKPFAAQVESWSNEKSTSWPCQWLSIHQVRNEYKLPKGYRLPEINSSILYWDKSKEAKAVWEAARDNYREYLTTEAWGYSFPDELAFNVAFAQTGVNPDIGQKIIEFNAQSKHLKDVQGGCFFIGCYGQYMSSYRNTYIVYDTVARISSRAIHGHNTPPKAHQLMGSKHVNNKPRKRPVDVRHEYYNRIPASYDLHNFGIIPHGLAAPKPFTNAFNGSKVGDLYAVRLERKPWFRDRKIAKMQMHGFAPGTPEIVPFKTENGHAEDPRCFELNGRPACLFNDGYQMWFGWLDTAECHKMTPPKPDFEDYDGREKNWTPFVHNKKLHVIYSPGHVVQYADLKTPNKEWKTEAPIYNYGAIRGGTQAVKVGNKLYTIFHTRHRSGPLDVYTAGMMELEAKQPFNVLRITPDPLWKATFHPGANIPDAPHKIKRMVTFVTFPSHLEVKDNEATIIAGWQDASDQIIRLPWDELLSHLEVVKKD
jgi:hypothetical protein